MKVIDKREINKVPFRDLKPGDTFMWNSDVYVKVNDSGGWLKQLPLEYNCACITGEYSGLLYGITPGANVTKVNCELTIKD